MICWLALLLTRVAEEHAGDTWATISTHMSRLSAVTLAGAAGTVVQSTEPTDKQRALPAACTVEPPARITALNPL